MINIFRPSFIKSTFYPLAPLLILCWTRSTLAKICEFLEPTECSLIYEFMNVPDEVWTEYGNYTAAPTCKIDQVIPGSAYNAFQFKRRTGPDYHEDILMLNASIKEATGKPGEAMIITNPVGQSWKEVLIAIHDGEVCAVFITVNPDDGIVLWCELRVQGIAECHILPSCMDLYNENCGFTKHRIDSENCTIELNSPGKKKYQDCNWAHYLNAV